MQIESHFFHVTVYLAPLTLLCYHLECWGVQSLLEPGLQCFKVPKSIGGKVGVMRSTSTCSSPFPSSVDESTGGGVGVEGT